MGRPLRGRESQKTWLNIWYNHRGLGFARKILRIKRDVPGSIKFGPGIFFAPDPERLDNYGKEEK